MYWAGKAKMREEAELAEQKGREAKNNDGPDKKNGNEWIVDNSKYIFDSEGK